jgi:acetyl esterase/lipase
VVSLKMEDNITCWSALLGKDVTKESVEDVQDLQYAAPARAASLRGLPPSFLEIGTLDLYHDETVDYAKRLVRDGQSLVELHVYPGLTHGYPGLGFASQLIQKTLDNRAQALRSI